MVQYGPVPRVGERDSLQEPRMRYRLLMCLLYGQYPWLTRHPGGLMTVPTAQVRRVLGTRNADLRAALDWGQDVGLWDSVAWHGGWFFVRPAPPIGMGRTLEATAHGL